MIPLHHVEASGNNGANKSSWPKINKKNIAEGAKSAGKKIFSASVAVGGSAGKAANTLTFGLAGKVTGAGVAIAKATPLLGRAVKSAEGKVHAFAKEIHDEKEAKKMESNTSRLKARKKLGEMVKSNALDNIDSFLKEAGLDKKDVEKLQHFAKQLGEVKGALTLHQLANNDAKAIFETIKKDLTGLDANKLDAATAAVLGEAMKLMFQGLGTAESTSKHLTKLLQLQALLAKEGFGVMLESPEFKPIHALLNKASQAMGHLKDLKDGQNPQQAIEGIRSTFKGVAESLKNEQKTLLNFMVVNKSDKKAVQQAQMALNRLDKEIKTLEKECTQCLENIGKGKDISTQLNIRSLQIALGSTIGQVNAVTKAMTEAIPANIEAEKSNEVARAFKTFLGIVGVAVSIAVAVAVAIFATVATGGLAGIPLILAASAAVVGFGASSLFATFNFAKLWQSANRLDRLNEDELSAKAFFEDSVKAFAEFDPVVAMLSSIDNENVLDNILSNSFDNQKDGAISEKIFKGLEELVTLNKDSNTANMFNQLAQNNRAIFANIVTNPNLSARHANHIMGLLDADSFNAVKNQLSMDAEGISNYEKGRRADLLLKLSGPTVAHIVNDMEAEAAAKFLNDIFEAHRYFGDKNAEVSAENQVKFALMFVSDTDKRNGIIDAFEKKRKNGVTNFLTNFFAPDNRSIENAKGDKAPKEGARIAKIIANSPNIAAFQTSMVGAMLAMEPTQIQETFDTLNGFFHQAQKDQRDNKVPVTIFPDQILGEIADQMYAKKRNVFDGIEMQPHLKPLALLTNEDLFNNEQFDTNFLNGISTARLQKAKDEGRISEDTIKGALTYCLDQIPEKPADDADATTKETHRQALHNIRKLMRALEPKMAAQELLAKFMNTELALDEKAKLKDNSNHMGELLGKMNPKDAGAIFEELQAQILAGEKAPKDLGKLGKDATPKQKQLQILGDRIAAANPYNYADILKKVGLKDTRHVYSTGALVAKGLAVSTAATLASPVILGGAVAGGAAALAVGTLSLPFVATAATAGLIYGAVKTSQGNLTVVTVLPQKLKNKSKDENLEDYNKDENSQYRELIYKEIEKQALEETNLTALVTVEKPKKMLGKISAALFGPVERANAIKNLENDRVLQEYIPNDKFSDDLKKDRTTIIHRLAIALYDKANKKPVEGTIAATTTEPIIGELFDLSDNRPLAQQPTGENQGGNTTDQSKFIFE